MKRGVVVKLFLLISIFGILVGIIGSRAQEENIPPPEQPPQESPPPEEQIPPPEQPPGEEHEQPPGEFPPPIKVAEGCGTERDETGVYRIHCEGSGPRCPPANLPADLKKQCEESGGREVIDNIPNGCNIARCSYSDEEKRGGFGGNCPLHVEFERIERRCKEQGLEFVVKRGLGCDIPSCAPKREKMCPELPFEEIRKAKEECGKSNGRLVKEFDERGCARPRCVSGQGVGPGGRPDRISEQECQKVVPKEAYDRCAEDEGGQLVVKTGQDGCVNFVKCVRRGDSNEIKYERVKTVPSSTKLIKIALELEKLKIELDKLAEQSEALSEYYEGKNDKVNIEKFKRVATMFEAAQERIDKIGEDLRKNARGLSTADINKFKRDLSYIDGVVLQDIAFVMLGGEPVGNLETLETAGIDEKISIEASGELGGDCGTNEGCFDRAFRICQPASMNPPGPPGGQIRVEIRGLYKKECVVEARGNFFGKEAEMECRFNDYAFVETSDEGIIKHCKGEMVEIMKKQFKEFSGPGGCKGQRECDNYCSTPENMRECLRFAKENGFTENLPPPEIQKAIEEGTFTGGPGGCKGPRECEEYCSKPEHGEECLEFAKKYGLVEHIPPEGFESPSRNFRRSPGEFGEGGFEEEFGGDFSGPGGCRSPEECRDYCSRTENYQECSGSGPGYEYNQEFNQEFDEGFEQRQEDFGEFGIVGQVIRTIGDWLRK
ncbi:hypothetical protein HYX18_00580 [Candidatus Woesearchaeota archaeon]|nr:hypothetical protein [Candidatus Woesearchaeota archaeon]